MHNLPKLFYLHKTMNMESTFINNTYYQLRKGKYFLENDIDFFFCNIFFNKKVSYFTKKGKL